MKSQDRPAVRRGFADARAPRQAAYRLASGGRWGAYQSVWCESSVDQRRLSAEYPLACRPSSAYYAMWDDRLKSNDLSPVPDPVPPYEP